MTKNQEKIQQFRHQVDKLRKFSDGFIVDSGVSFSWSQDDGVARVAEHGPSEEKTVAVFVAIRPFIMKDRINFEALCREIIETTDKEEIKKKSENVLSAWYTCLDRPEGKTENKILMRVGQKEINREQNLNTWMNEEHFHPENYKHDGSRGLSQIKSHPWFAGMSKMQMIDTLQKMTVLILWFDKQVLSNLQND